MCGVEDAGVRKVYYGNYNGQNAQHHGYKAVFV